MLAIHRRTFVFAVLVLACFPIFIISRSAGQPKEGQVVLSRIGYVVPVRQVMVSPKVPGQVVEILVQEGQAVKAGEVLARLDSAEYEARLQVERAKLERAKLFYEKMKTGSGKLDVRLAEVEVALAEAQLRLAQMQLDFTLVRAPFDCTVIAKKAEVGSLVNPGAFNVASSICEIADLRELEVDVAVEENQLANVYKGQKCSIQSRTNPQVTYKGFVSRFLPVADRAKGAIPLRVRIEIPEKGEGPRPESSAIVQFLGKE
jgi:RND family efflux transporter MFP subunit